MAERRSSRKGSATKCDASGCDNEAARSLPRKKVEPRVEFSLGGDGKKVSLCRKHYQLYKKATKEDRKLDALGR